MTPLATNESRATVFEGGSLKFEFGPKVPDRIRKAAMKWAEKKGLTPSEASLAKSEGSYSYATFSRPGQHADGKVEKTFSWFI